MTPTILQVLGALIPIVVAIVTVPLFDFLKQKVIPFVDGLPAPLQQALVTIVVALLTYLTSLTGIQFPTTVTGLDPTTVSTCISALLAFLLKNAQHASATKAAIVATAQRVGAAPPPSSQVKS